MKRSEALAPLSRDHHVALVVARELSRASADDASAAADRFVAFLARHELAHFALEESVLLPAVRDDQAVGALVRQVVADHAYFREAMRRLKRTGEPSDLEWLHQLGARLSAHVRMEERELFPHIERSLSDAELEEVGAALRA